MAQGCDAAGSHRGGRQQRHLVDINVATVEELSTLQGVGRSRAEAIVETRNVSLSFSYLFRFTSPFSCLHSAVSCPEKRAFFGQFTTRVH